jgi:hypothetical protein
MRGASFVQAAVAGILAVGLASAARADAEKKDGGGMGGDGYECQGGNMCKAKGDCGGPGYSCAGNNKCIGKGFVSTKNKEECVALVAKVKAAIEKKKSVKKAKQG